MTEEQIERLKKLGLRVHDSLQDMGGTRSGVNVAPYRGDVIISAGSESAGSVAESDDGTWVTEGGTEHDTLEAAIFSSVAESL